MDKTMMAIYFLILLLWGGSAGISMLSKLLKEEQTGSDPSIASSAP
ncbi:MAG: hypothetical protein ACLR3S_04660 [Clostridium fessum]